VNIKDISVKQFELWGKESCFIKYEVLEC
jgi:hypothetical protein